MSYTGGGRIVLNNQREAQISRFRTWVLLAVPLAAIFFQIYVPQFFHFLSFLEMPLLVVVYFALMRRSQIQGLLIGALVGLAQDSLLGIKNPLGMFGIVKTLVGYFAASVSVRFDVDNVLVRLLLAFFFFVFHQFFYWVMARALLNQQIGFDLQHTLLNGLLNGLVGISLFHFLDKMRETV
jgi:rod shape-determining protein MreD